MTLVDQTKDHKCRVCGGIGFKHKPDDCPLICHYGRLHQATDHQ